MQGKALPRRGRATARPASLPRPAPGRPVDFRSTAGRRTRRASGPSAGLGRRWTAEGGGRRGASRGRPRARHLGHVGHGGRHRHPAPRHRPRPPGGRQKARRSMCSRWGVSREATSTTTAERGAGRPHAATCRRRNRTTRATCRRGRRCGGRGWDAAGGKPPSSVPEALRRWALAVRREPVDVGAPPHHHPGPAFGYATDGAVRFERSPVGDRAAHAGGGGPEAQ
jgi:hypothetical protein